MKVGMSGIGDNNKRNPIYKIDLSSDINFCYDLEQYLGAEACCYDYSCTYAKDCEILRDSVRA